MLRLFRVRSSFGKWVVSGILLLALLVGAAPARAELPPLIDREILFGDPDIIAAQLSPDGKYISFVRPLDGTRNVWVKRTEESFDRAKPVTAETTRPIAGYFWSRDSKYILYVRDNAGDENFNVYAVNPADPPATGAKVPAARNLTNLPGVRALIYHVPKKDTGYLYVGLNDRDKAWHDVYKLNISTGEKELVLKNTDRFISVSFDLDDRLRLVGRSAPNGDTEILRVHEDGLEKIYSCNVFETCGPSRFHQDGQRVYFISNAGADVDLTRLTLVDVATGREELVESDPERRVNIAAPMYSPKTDELVGTAYVDDRTRVYWRDDEREKIHNHLKSKFPDREISLISETLDERLALIGIHADVEPGEVYLLERDTLELTRQFGLRENLPRAALSPMTAIRYRSSDGLEIPGYLTVPKGLEPKSLPLVVVPHGGPWARDTWGYNTLAQFFANRGFAVLMPNFRGSVGYGKKFTDAGNGQWGEKMQDDITWGVKHLIEQGIADPERVAIMGGSYGGYATLAGVAFTPDLYAAAVSLVGPSNLITLLNTIPPYWEAGRRQLYTRVADPTTPEGKAKLQRQSPLNSAEKIKTPLMVVQGANDPRVKKAESEQIVVALRDRKFPVEYLLAADEGHGFAKPINNLAAYAAIEKFLAKHVPGVRHQEEMSPEVAQQLKRLIVDPSTVKVAGGQ